MVLVSIQIVFCAVMVTDCGKQSDCGKGMVNYRMKKNTKPMQKKAEGNKKKETRKILTPKTPHVPKEWLYLNKEELSMEQVRNAMEEIAPEKVEFWEAAGVIEVELPGGTNLDMEVLEQEDIESCEFTAEEQIKTAYLVALVPEAYEEAEKVMRAAVSKLGGFFCGNTDEFQPRISG